MAEQMRLGVFRCAACGFPYPALAGRSVRKGSKLRLLKSRDVAPLEIEIGSRSFCRWAAAAGAVALLVLSNETAFPMVGDDSVRS